MSDPSPNSPEYLKLQSILENAVDAIITINDRGIIESANPATTLLFQYPVEELIGRNVSDLMPPPYREEHGGYIESYLTTGTRKIIGIGREVMGQRKDGSTFPVHLAVSEITFDGRRVFTGIARDMSDLKKAEQKLIALNDELEERVRHRTEQLRVAQAELVKKERLAILGQVSGGIAHEIRNPLNAVKTSAYYLLNATNPSDEKQREHLNRIDRQVSKIDSVITALSDVAKMPDPTVSSVSVESILRSVIHEVSIPPSISVQLDIDDDAASMMVDEYQIPIVFKNLLRNARDAMPDGGTIIVRAEPSDDKIVISVTDTGVGIAEADLSRILEPLYSTKARGMGLGLAICKAIVEKNGGRLVVQSELGEGSTFTVEISGGRS